MVASVAGGSMGPTTTVSTRQRTRSATSFRRSSGTRVGLLQPSRILVIQPDSLVPTGPNLGRPLASGPTK
jgi:hypothetical protein